MIKCIVCAVSAVLPLASASRSAAAPAGSGSFSGHLELVLLDALFRGPVPAASERRNLVLHLEARDGRWQHILGHALSYSNGMSWGLVEASDVTDERMRLGLGMVINGDQWLRSTDRGSFTVEIPRSAAGEMSGTYQGIFKGQKVSGRAVARAFPLQPVAGDYKPLEPGEHPRLLLRRHELPALRKRLETPFGKAYLAQAQKSGDIVSLGMLYQLTGEKKYAEQAQAQIAPTLADPDGAFIDVKGGGSGSAGHALNATAHALDLCYDAWPEAFREKVKSAMMEVLPRMMRYCMVTSHANPHPCSNYFGPGHGAPAIASLVLLGEKGEAMPLPEDPVKSASIILPAEDFQPGEGAPVVDLAPGSPLTQWLYAGPAPRRSRNDVLGAIGGYAKARPRVGTQVRSGVMIGDKIEMTTLTFQPLPEAMLKNGSIDVAKLVPAGGPATAIFYAVLRVKERQTVSFGSANDLRAWLNDTELSSGGYYSLRPGLYPMMLVYATDRAGGALSPRLDAVGSGIGAEGAELHRLELALVESYKAQCAAMGGASTAVAQVFEQGWLRMYQHYRYGIGDGGYAAETKVYADIASRFPLYYNAYHLKAMGRQATYRPDVNLLPVRRMMQTIFLPQGGHRHETIGPTGGWITDFVAAAFNAVPDAYKPSMLWGWNHVAGVKEGDPESLAGLFGRRGGGGGLHGAHTFVNYPLGMKAVHPREGMPGNWEARDFGWYCFRNGWEGDEAIVAQMYLKSKPVGGWSIPGAGTFRLSGLGRDWVGGFASKEAYRFEEGVLLLPDDKVNILSCAHPMLVQFNKDGSGALTADMNDLYGTTREAEGSRKTPAKPDEAKADEAKAGEGKAGEGKAGEDTPEIVPTRLYGRDGIRRPEAWADSGVNGLRAFGIDYSGKSGAPLLMVIVDKVTGGGKRDWNWPYPHEEGRGAKATPSAKVEGNAFVLRYDERASLKATFISPEKVTIDPASKVRIDYKRWEGRFVEYSRISTTADSGSFFVIITLQRGAPPAVSAQGKGLDATVTVGSQTVRFDGQKVVFGP